MPVKITEVVKKITILEQKKITNIAGVIKNIIITQGDTTQILKTERKANVIILANSSNKVIKAPRKATVHVSSTGRTGPPGPRSEKNWDYYALNVEYTGVDTAIAAGSVKSCTLAALTIYRFINSTLNANGYPLEDSFYSDFDGTNLTNLIVTRGT